MQRLKANFKAFKPKTLYNKVFLIYKYTIKRQFFQYFLGNFLIKFSFNLRQLKKTVAL